jgi:hypothetical protein
MENGVCDDQRLLMAEARFRTDCRLSHMRDLKDAAAYGGRMLRHLFALVLALAVTAAPVIGEWCEAQYERT